MKITVLGAGTWGIALARLLSQNGNSVYVWSKISSEIEALSGSRVHPNLPGMQIPNDIIFTDDMENAMKDTEMAVFAVPSVYIRNTANECARFITENMTLVVVAKGIEPITFFTLSEVITDELKKCNVSNIPPVVALSGPTHAEEVALDMPTAIVSASEDTAAAVKVQNTFMNSYLRVYTNEDILGVELCGAVKNVIALAAGIARGLGCGDNAMAAIITRGIEELKRLGLAMGASERTFSGLAGIGDMIVTATSMHSRNNRCGILIGQGKSVEEAKNEVGMVVEGINALPATLALAKKYNVEMPIVSLVGEIILNHMDPKEAIPMLMDRKKKSE